MRIKRFFYWLFSFIVTKPIHVGYGLSVDNTTLPEEPEPRKATNLVFFALRKDLGAFEISRVIRGKDKSVRFEVYYPESDRKFTIPKSLFDLLFEEIEIKNTDWKSTIPPNKVK